MSIKRLVYSHNFQSNLIKILILVTTFSNIVQRVLMELKTLNHTLDEHYNSDKKRLIEQVGRFQPNVIVCPYLTQRIPSEVWGNYISLVMHPGIIGDRGPSPLDWSISEGDHLWGVTLFQAEEEFDAGNIWETQYFRMREASKTSIYNREVTKVAVSLIKQALQDIEYGHFNPKPLDHDHPILDHYALKCIGAPWTESPKSFQDNVSCIHIGWVTVMLQVFLNHFVRYIPCCSGTIPDRPKMLFPISFF